jgi:hypothetical protein
MIHDARRTLTICLAVAGIALATAGSAQGAINVTNTNDSGPGSLRQATEEAPPGETINVPAGTYTLTSESLVIVKGLTIAGSGAGSTIVRAGGQFRVLVAAGEFDLTISGLTIRDGNEVDAGGIVQGGGILSSGVRLTLRNVVVTGNTANGDGAAGQNGGIVQGGGLFQAGGSLTLVESTISGNNALARGASEQAGGIVQGGGLWAASSVTVSNSMVSGNLASALGGQGPSNTEQVGGIIQGGGLWAVASGGSSLSFAGLTLSGNLADASGGPGGKGGIIQGGGSLLGNSVPVASLSNATITSNVARADGAGAGIIQGGGVIATNSETAPFELLSVTFSGNRVEPATVLGGGGNLLTAGPFTIRNSIIAAGSGPMGSENCSTNEELSSLGFNIDSLDQCGFKTAGDKVNTDPLLGPLQSNGGPTQTMVPASNSPAVDQGKSFGLGTDQRGVLRPIDLPTIANSVVPGADGTDIGAVELQPSNALALGKLKKNKKKGTATLTVFLPPPSAGTLTLAGKGLKTQTAAITGQTQLKLKVLPKGKVKKALRKKGKRKVQINVTYSPTGNNAATATRKAKLVRKHRKRSRKRSK